MKSSFLFKLNCLLTKKDKKMLLLLLLMSFILSIIETIGITAIMPFISIASNPDLIFSNEYYQIIYSFFEFSSSKDFIISFGITLIVFYILRGLYTILHAYTMNLFSMMKYSEFANRLYENYLSMPYQKFVDKNSATMSKVIITEAQQLSFLIQSILVFLSEVIIIIILYILLLLVDIKMTLVLTMLLGIKVIFLTKIVSKKIKQKGKKRASLQDTFYRTISETLRNFKIIKFISNQAELQNKFTDMSEKYAKVYIISNTLKLIPRSVLEALGLSMLMSVVIYIVAYENNVENVIPVISMYALALYRILPAITRILASYNNILFYVPTVDIVYNDLQISYPKEKNENITFHNEISLEKISFAYNLKEYVINNLSLKINKGTKIAFIGESGSGKSTLVDIICGLYKPSSGKIIIDENVLDGSNIVSWRKRIGYIPQDIYLFDGTISQNISFGREYDEDKVIKVLKQANMYNFIMRKEGLKTMVGEDGIQLSGGQKQRIGIARALYGDPEVLVLDEGTSALDIETEAIIMDEIYKISINKTLIIIAHRLSTIENCDVKIDMERFKND